jgi:uncharacterized protein (DUF433 family)
MFDGRMDDPQMNYQDIITIEDGKRGGRPCVRGLRIAVADVLGWLAAGLSHEQILVDYPELTENGIFAPAWLMPRIANGGSSPLQNEAAIR